MTEKVKNKKLSGIAGRLVVIASVVVFSVAAALGLVPGQPQNVVHANGCQTAVLHPGVDPVVHDWAKIQDDINKHLWSKALDDLAGHHFYLWVGYKQNYALGKYKVY